MRRAGCFILGAAGIIGLYWYASVGTLPELKILAENGNALHTGSMEYG